MKANLGSVEKAIRIILGLVLIGLAYTGTLGVWAYLGIIFVVTGLVSWCPAWLLLRINTRKESSANPE